jgi:hypothetical protein
MNQPTVGGSYVLPVYRGDVRHTVIVWNGVADYQRMPPEDFSTVNMGGLTIEGKVSITQVGKPVGCRGRSAVAMLGWLLESFDSVIFWARDTKTYNSIRDELKSAGQFQPSEREEGMNTIKVALLDNEDGRGASLSDADAERILEHALRIAPRVAGEIESQRAAIEAQLRAWIKRLEAQVPAAAERVLNDRFATTVSDTVKMRSSGGYGLEDFGGFVDEIDQKLAAASIPHWARLDFVYPEIDLGAEDWIRRAFGLE